MAEVVVKLRDGTELPGADPIVIVGPNGSGKTREAHRLGEQTTNPIEFVNAMRSPRFSPQLPAMSQTQARQQHDHARKAARTQHWELASDFDVALSQLLAEDGDAARAYREKSKAGEAVAHIGDTALERIVTIWARTFPGRRLEWKDWSPVVHNERGSVETYSASQMSDGERAALYLMCKVLLVAPNLVLVVDEPETHFHSQLAVRLWDELESAREDLRFVYVTHDLVFALSREPAQFLLADPRSGLVPVAMESGLPAEVRREILGAASFSYFASRVVFCEGEDHSLDKQFLSAWFRSRDTVVLPAGSCAAVRDCVSSLAGSKLIDNLDAIGVIDRDFHPDSYFARLDPSVFCLPVHEIEGILCLPGVIDRLALHLSRALSKSANQLVLDAITEEMLSRVAFERARQQVLNAVEDRILSKPGGYAENDLRNHLGAIEGTLGADATLVAVYESELAHAREVRLGGDPAAVVRLFPSKPVAATVATVLGLSVRRLFDLVCGALAAGPNDPLAALGADLEVQLAVLKLPARQVAERQFTNPA